jgi:SET domain-containing protein
MTDLTYLPLPSSVTIDRSDIHGLGLWAVEEIKEGTEIGMSHFYWGDTLQRTPLGGFYNHSDDPNIVKVQRDSRMFICALREIRPGEELTCSYTLYELKKL